MKLRMLQDLHTFIHRENQKPKSLPERRISSALLKEKSEDYLAR